jgi:hypothetical protein
LPACFRSDGAGSGRSADDLDWPKAELRLSTGERTEADIEVGGLMAARDSFSPFIGRTTC